MGTVVMPSGERRRSQRMDAATMDVFVGRIRPGVPVRVLELSATGCLIETGTRLVPGARVDFQVQRHGHTAGARAAVVRCFVGTLAGTALTYRGALHFESELSWVSTGSPI